MASIEYDEFGFIIEDTTASTSSGSELEAVPVVPIRTVFPPDGTEYLGGRSDGWEYRTVFAGGRLSTSYEMVVSFLREHGYGDIPIPAHSDDLKLFRRQRTPQLQLFPERGYVHNPIKILFHSDSRMRNALVLCLYNEEAENHLLRFHGVLKEVKKPS